MLIEKTRFDIPFDFEWATLALLYLIYIHSYRPSPIHEHEDDAACSMKYINCTHIIYIYCSTIYILDAVP